MPTYTGSYLPLGFSIPVLELVLVLPVVLEEK